MNEEFDCGQGQCIARARLCDMVVDCGNRRDEDKSRCLQADLCNGHRCLSGRCIAKSRVNDLVPDCPGPEADDEPELAVHSIVGTFQCPSSQLPCLMFHSRCYPAELFCVYDLDTDGYLYPCRTGGHLHQCSGVKCPGKYKCPQAYCIPTHRVCDGVADCPAGQDEMNCVNRTCPGLLKCKQSGLCVNIRDIHNNHAECTGSNDDEILREEECLSGCLCVGSAVSCTARDSDSVPKIPVKTKIFVLSRNKLRLIATSFLDIEKVRIIDTYLLSKVIDMHKTVLP